MSPEKGNEFYQGFLAHLRGRYPRTAATFQIEERLSPFLVSPHKLDLPAGIKAQAEAVVQAFFALRNEKERSARLTRSAPATPDPGNASVLMSYDFHVDTNGDLRLIEINTNASLSLIVSSLYRYQNVQNRFSGNFEEEILASFENEFAVHPLSKSRQLRNVAIVDEKPEMQRLFVEFKFFKELFETRGYRTEIADASQLSNDGLLRFGNEPIDLVYNRDTDFYFETPACAPMRKAFIEKTACFSPNPHEYRLLADKARLLELSDPANADLAALPEAHRGAIRKALIPTVEVSAFGGAEEMWQERKRFFFKPKRMFGGKAVYKGASITRSVFNDIYSENYLAQENVPAGKVKFGSEEFKFDLRFFVYRDRIQLGCARLYRGQTTNASTPGGGSTVINWV